MQANDMRSVEDRERDTDRAVLTMLLADLGLWSVDEVLRESADALEAEDSLSRLHATGLLHRIGEGFVLPTGAAVRANALGG
jgi:hypothetical protein